MGTWLGSVERVKRANKNLCAKETRKKKGKRKRRTALKTHHYPAFLLWDGKGTFMNTLPGPRRFKICYACVYVFSFHGTFMGIPPGLDSSWSTTTLATEVLRFALLGFLFCRRYDPFLSPFWVQNCRYCLGISRN